MFVFSSLILGKFLSLIPCCPLTIGNVRRRWCGGRIKPALSAFTQLDPRGAMIAAVKLMVGYFTHSDLWYFYLAALAPFIFTYTIFLGVPSFQYQADICFAGNTYHHYLNRVTNTPEIGVWWLDCLGESYLCLCGIFIVVTSLCPVLVSHTKCFFLIFPFFLVFDGVWFTDIFITIFPFFA